MAPSTVTGHVLARSLSHGGIAGAVVGSVVGATLIFLLILPFILRCIREHRYRKQIAQENAEMGITGGSNAAGESYHPPFLAPAADQGPSGPPTHTSGDATATLGDNNSSDDGKTSASPPSPLLSAAAVPVKDQEAAPPVSSAPALPGPAGTDAPAVPPPATVRSSADTVSASEDGPTPGPAATRGLPAYLNASQQQNDQRPLTPPRKLNPAYTFPILSQEPMPRITPRQRSSTMRSSRQSSSLSQSLEGFFGGRLLRQGSNRSTPTRSPTMRSTRGPAQMARSPVEIGFDNLDPINHHTWLMRQQGIEDYSTGVDPTFFEVDYQHLTGASAEYYSGAPLSPPTDPSSSFMAPISYASSPPSMIASSFATMAAAAGIAGVASSAKKQPKTLISRTDSMRTTATGTDFSPLPLSPTSPLPKVQEGFESGDGERGIAMGENLASRGVSSAGLTPEPAESMRRSPSYGGLVPSPQMPAPGTVNPMDVWAPATEDERFIHKTAELDRIEQSPPPVRSSQSGSVSATDISPRESSSSPFPSEFLVDDFADEEIIVKAPEEPEATPTATVLATQPTPVSQPSPAEDAATNSLTYSSTGAVEAVSPEIKIKREEHSEPATPAAPLGENTQQPTPEVEANQGIVAPKVEQAYTKATTISQPDSADLEELMTDDFQGGINFAFGDGVSYNYAQETNSSVYLMDAKSEAVSAAPACQTLPQQSDAMYWPAPVDMTSQMPGQMQHSDMSGTMPNMVHNTMSTPMPPTMPNMISNTMPNTMPPSMPPSMHPMMQQMPTTMAAHANVPSISEPYLMPGNQMEYPNGMLLTSPFTVPNNGYPGMNNMGGMHTATFSNGMPASHYSLHTPQSSPGHYAGQHQMNGNAPYYPQQGTGLPLTPPPKGMANFNSPLSVPGYDGSNGPVSPLSNQGSTPTHGSSLSPRTHTCEECGRVFDQVHKLNHHKRYHERPHECAVVGCGKRFGTKTHLDRHVNDKHSKSRKYHCTEDGCPYSLPGGKSFPRKDNWRRHMVNKHGVQPEHDPIEVVDQPMVGM
ncbi:zinc finger protein 2 [Ophiostoma piceae UAMH 11346]|uniref:Zinc finger protein 2 n=1 Tax=Ophiostoma piceae (strain UAMH 11346) TaxID=1262450 RepID=S3CUV9_OPHP1|nr:zinc finger protein 2 [Ophiostoma piceae UAMH 11346]